MNNSKLSKQLFYILLTTPGHSFDQIIDNIIEELKDPRSEVYKTIYQLLPINATEEETSKDDMTAIINNTNAEEQHKQVKRIVLSYIRQLDKDVAIQIIKNSKIDKDTLVKLLDSDNEFKQIIVNIDSGANKATEASVSSTPLTLQQVYLTLYKDLLGKKIFSNIYYIFLLHSFR